ncbi:MAG: hypothetical protein HY512_04180 [Candidatus Aenigmarchaeota archaeon]|nr:hypothetical protein [Candidatus Aenigmarchaeota archaeon]
MSDLYLFKITKADIQMMDNGGIKVRLWYPANPAVTGKRLPPNPEWGVHVFETFLRDGYATLATPDNPIRPSSAGSAYLFADDVLLAHRRDSGAPTHKLYHSIPGGFPRNKDEVSTETGLMMCGLRESAEENVILTRENKPKLLLPMGYENFTTESAGRLFGQSAIIDGRLPIMYIQTELLDPPDVLEVYTDEGPLFSARAFLEVMFDSEPAVNALQVARMGRIDSDSVTPMDAEFMRDNSGRTIFFNRESYLLPLADLNGCAFGDPLQDPTVYKTEWRSCGWTGDQPFPMLRTMVDYKPQPEKTGDPEKPFFGPDMKPARHSHIWAPDDMLIRILDGLGVSGYEGRWAEIQLEKEKEAIKK